MKSKVIIGMNEFHISKFFYWVFREISLKATTPLCSAAVAETSALCVITEKSSHLVFPLNQTLARSEPQPLPTLALLLSFWLKLKQLFLFVNIMLTLADGGMECTVYHDK